MLHGRRCSRRHDRRSVSTGPEKPCRAGNAVPSRRVVDTNERQSDHLRRRRGGVIRSSASSQGAAGSHNRNSVDQQRLHLAYRFEEPNSGRVLEVSTTERTHILPAQEGRRHADVSVRGRRVHGHPRGGVQFPAAPAKTDGQQAQIVFVYAGDLWAVPREGGDARRLTAGVGVETTRSSRPTADQSPSPASTRATSTSTSCRPPAACPGG